MLRGRGSCSARCGEKTRPHHAAFLPCSWSLGGGSEQREEENCVNGTWERQDKKEDSAAVGYLVWLAKSKSSLWLALYLSHAIACETISWNQRSRRGNDYKTSSLLVDRIVLVYIYINWSKEFLNPTCSRTQLHCIEGNFRSCERMRI